ncbi:MAG: restriction endonuclease subunit S [Betaproteobacteria bacterium]|nr:restriction endonuclease subunit S [Betaproteobacteria bacterium]
MSIPSVRLKELCEVITKGTTPTSLGFDFADNGVGFIRVQNVTGGKVNYEQDTLFIDEHVHRELNRSQILPGDVLLSIAGTIGRTGLVPENAPPLNCNQAIAIVRPTDRVYRPYLRHWLECNDAQSQMRGSTVMGTIQNLSLAQIGSLRVPLPPLPKQRRIAAILDQADALRAKRREALAQLDSLIQSTFIEMFGDLTKNPKNFSVQSFGNICDVRDGTHDSPKYVSSGFPLVTTKNLRNGKIDFSGVNLISEADYHAINKRSKVNKGDILMPMIGTIGNPILVDEQLDFAIKNMALIKFTNNSPQRQFILGFLKSKCFKRLVVSKNKGGTQKFLALGEIRALPIPVPPQPLQKTFSDVIEMIQQHASKFTNSLTELDILFASLQHRAFRGEL